MPEQIRQHGAFGRLAPLPREEHPRLSLEDYVDFARRASLPKPSPRVDRASKVSSWPMYLNDQIGDCTCAAVGHEIQGWTAYASTEYKVADSSVLSMYSAVSGYDPATGANDNGAVIQQVLQYWQANPVEGHTISAFAELKNFYNIRNLKEAAYLFGSVYFGINCPQSALDQFNQGLPWEYVPGSPIAGGHAIVLQEVMEPGVKDMFRVVTWGQLQPMNIEFMRHYVEEAWVVISPDWMEASGVDPDGFNLAQLQADFQSMT